MATIGPFRGIHPDARRFTPADTWRAGDAGPAWTVEQIRARLAAGALVRDARAAFYQVEVAHGPPDDRRHASGFVARLLPTGIVPASDTGRRGEAGHDVGLPVLRYEDPRGWVDEVLSSNAMDEILRFTADDGSEHRLFRVDRAEAVQEVVAQFEDRELRMESGARLLRQAAAHWRATGKPGDAAAMVLLAPEGPEPAPWREGLVLAALDEPAPVPWQEMAGGPGKPRFDLPPL
jgi:hypothetical protein